MNVKEGHENADDQTLGLVGRVAYGVTQGIRPAFDLDKAFLGVELALIQDDSVRGRKKVTQIRIGWADGITEEMELRKPTNRFVAVRPDVVLESILKLL